MPQAYFCVEFSDTSFYNHFKSTTDIFESLPVDSEIIFGTMVFRWDDHGGLIHTGTLESRPLDAYREVGHFEWDPAEPNVLHCMDTNSDEGDSNTSQSSRTD